MVSDNIANSLFVFAREAKECTDVPALGRLFQDLVAPYGVTASSAWAVIGGDVKLSRGFGEWPKVWARHYADQRYFEVDPVFESLLKGFDAGYWDELVSNLPVSQAGLKVMEDAAAHGYADGYSRLIPTLNGSYYLVSLYGKTLVRDPNVRILFDLASIKFVHEGVMLLNRRVGTPLKDHDLTKRQIEVLQAKANGQTDKQTADRLGVSVKAVEGHLTKIRKQMNARTTSQAIGLARGKGLIPRSYNSK
ncbi:helix-turn-helix transcriptional regulator [Hirschia baltica]|uniref:Transcriptional regulator, LuxR family n=1 Tax=Hirschia baltica (strain ATCC 49814 / DSM 5838 / IFAM 1418) TaxID=582402 RepID=C6XPJ3_HIRBI|nr:LuxR family transcriptional regulator [Hirschia baltica]ACT58479.1 transcriptional regulator, LuxR family [Hirschia baltica ATCC 49814]